MLIEYAGELVRRSVADARERRCYDKLVGAGTYVFGLNEDVCVDATRAGEASLASRAVMAASHKDTRAQS
jgi:hypothetical protein